MAGGWTIFGNLPLVRHLSSSDCTHLQPQSETRSWISQTVRVATSTCWDQTLEMSPWKPAQTSLALTPGHPPTTSREAAQLQTKRDGELMCWRRTAATTAALANTDLHRGSYQFPDSFTNNEAFKTNQTDHWTLPIVERDFFSPLFFSFFEKAAQKQAWVWGRHPVPRSTLCQKTLLSHTQPCPSRALPAPRLRRETVQDCAEDHED